MHTRDEILERLKLLPEDMLREVLLFIDCLLGRLQQTTPNARESKSSFAEALGQFRAMVEAEGSDLEERDFFAGVRDRTPAPEEARW